VSNTALKRDGANSVSPGDLRLVLDRRFAMMNDFGGALQALTC